MDIVDLIAFLIFLGWVTVLVYEEKLHPEARKVLLVALPLLGVAAVYKR